MSTTKTFVGIDGDTTEWDFHEPVEMPVSQLQRETLRHEADATDDQWSTHAWIEFGPAESTIVTVFSVAWLMDRIESAIEIAAAADWGYDQDVTGATTDSARVRRSLRKLAKKAAALGVVR